MFSQFKTVYILNCNTRVDRKPCLSEGSYCCPFVSYLDLIAIPDFAAGAMENWGLITYRETALLYDPKVASAANMERVAVVVAHELAHQVALYVVGASSVGSIPLRGLLHH